MYLNILCYNIAVWNNWKPIWQKWEGISLLPRREVSQHDNVLPVQNETSVHEKPADDPLNELSGQTDYLFGLLA